MKIPHFYAVIIGSEILNGRRDDKHFLYLREALMQRGHTLFASFIIKDDHELIRSTYAMIQNDSHAVMFSFGGIGSTPDDLTRQIASEVFSDGELVSHEKFYTDILERFGNEAFPNRIHMANLPKKAELLPNIINNMSGFYLENRYFFMPGFPEMSHPMVDYILKNFYPQAPITYRKTLIAQTSENTLIPIMKQLDQEVDFSSLPMLNSGKASVEISVASTNEVLCDQNFELFIHELNAKKFITLLFSPLFNINPNNDDLVLRFYISAVLINVYLEKKMLNYLLIALVIIIIAYIGYRRYFFQKHKSDHPIKPHFTLKIEHE